jgi:hypothetical protein
MTATAPRPSCTREIDAYDERERIAQQLDSVGHAIVENHLPLWLCDRLCGYCDEVLGPAQREIADTPWMPSGINPFDPANPPWSAVNLAMLLAAGKPCVTSRRFRHEIRHPIEDAKALAAATTAGRMVELHAYLLRSTSERLRLMQHMLVRTDYDPHTAAGPRDWHADHAFLSQDYTESPRRIFYHSVIALKDVPPGGGGTMLIPESLRRARRILDQTSQDDLMRHCQATASNGFGCNLRTLADVNPRDCAAEPIEISLRKGDMMIFDPMQLHAESVNTMRTPRYVLFQNFFDVDAVDQCLPLRGSSAPAIKFPDAFRHALGHERVNLCDWTYPSSTTALEMALARL